MALAKNQLACWLRTTVIALAAACLLNAAVAVCCALWSPVGARQVIDVTEDPRGWPIPVPDDWPPIDAVDRWSGFGLDHETATVSMLEATFLGSESQGMTVAFYEAERIRVGWPWRAFASTRRAHVKSEGGLLASSQIAPPHAPWRFAIAVDANWSARAPRASAPRVIPILPLPLGFTLNTISYAGSLLTILALRHFVRTHRRRACCRCVSCGYAVGAIDPCPECGAASPRRDVAASDTVSDHGGAEEQAQDDS